MDIYNKKYTIKEVLDNDTQERSIQWGYRVGRECFIISIQTPGCLVVEYLNGNVFRTSTIQEVKESEREIIVKTSHRTYLFELMEEQ